VKPQVRRAERRNLVIPIALTLILAAVVLDWALYPSCGGIGEPVLRLCCGMLPGGLAIYLLIKRPRLTSVHLTAFVLVGGITGIIAALFLQLVYRPPLIRSGWRSEAPPQERNQLGFRGRPIVYTDKEKVVVLLGDSQVEALAMPFDAMPERVLEAHLNVSGKTARVFTVGTGGYGQDQQLLALTEFYKRYRADLVLLWETPGNDVWNNMFSTHMHACSSPKPTYWLENGVLRGPTELLEQPVASSPIVIVALWQRVFVLPRRERNWQRKLPKPYSPATRYSGAVRREWQERWKSNFGNMRWENLATEKSHMALTLSPPSERTKYGMQLTRALIDRISRLVTDHHGRLVLMQAQPARVTPPDEVYLLNGKYYNVSRRQMEAIWKQINQGYDTESVSVTSANWRVGPENAHLNAAATEQVMRDLAPRVVSRLEDDVAVTQLH
jgi:hypothetical protein